MATFFIELQISNMPSTNKGKFENLRLGVFHYFDLSQVIFESPILRQIRGKIPLFVLSTVVYFGNLRKIHSWKSLSQSFAIPSSIYREIQLYHCALFFHAYSNTTFVKKLHRTVRTSSHPFSVFCEVLLRQSRSLRATLCCLASFPG